MKIKAKRKECSLAVYVNTSWGEKIDKKELDRFSRMYLRGFLQPNMTKKNQIEYKGPVGISLFERLQKPMTKRDFLFIMEHIIIAVQKIHANSLMLNHLVMDIQYVYINEITKEIQFLYLPLETTSSRTNLIKFLHSIIYCVKPQIEQDMNYVSRFVYVLNNLKPFRVDELEKHIAREDKSVVNTIKKYHAGQSGFMTDKPQHYYEYYDKKKVTDGEATDLLRENDDEATELLSQNFDNEATGLLMDDNDEATGLLQEVEEDEGTTLLEETRAYYHSVHYPTLVRMATQEEISINKPVFRIGKEKSYVDYFVTNNSAVSRGHADIITRTNRYFIKDLNSKNYTFINGQKIWANQELELLDGDRIKLANEEFIFHV